MEDDVDSEPQSEWDAVRGTDQGSALVINRKDGGALHKPQDGDRHPSPYHSVDELPMSDCLPEVPRTAHEMYKQQEWRLWLEAMKEEVDTMEAMNVFDIVDRPADQLVVKSGWVFQRKIDLTSKRVMRHRARLVGKGYSQVYGEHYGETWSPVVRWDTLRTMLAYCASRRYKLRTFDISKAFLNADLDFAVHMEPPDGFEYPTKSVWLLKKAIYGLKQAGAQWYDRLTKFVKSSLKGEKSKMDPCIFRVNGKYYDMAGEHAFVLIYVDDIPILSTCSELAKAILSRIEGEFDLSKSGEDEDQEMLGVKIIQDPETGVISLDHSLHIRKLVTDYGMTVSAGPGMRTSPGVAKLRLTENCGEAVDEKGYQKLVGRLQYVANTTRPDIAYCTNSVARFTHNPGHEHWEAALRIVRYLAVTIDYMIRYERNDETPVDIEGWSDADWFGHPNWILGEWGGGYDRRRTCDLEFEKAENLSDQHG
jgi:hypothetical protein